MCLTNPKRTWRTTSQVLIIKIYCSNPNPETLTLPIASPICAALRVEMLDQIIRSIKSIRSIRSIRSFVLLIVKVVVVIKIVKIVKIVKKYQVIGCIVSSIIIIVYNIYQQQ